ncbi:ribonuclease HIII [Ignavigranum ruoffiae]|uniref:ribonuclease HIII n=1 Tax=Ignavigranum ruoffiae TaxID=89093 RepID=UPI00206F07CF|nr:ribonuclease HIII [Ignavigranum ruoffiae]UPQ85717.1 ribonuclease HIII [Ignavigranum ruoffiae]
MNTVTLTLTAQQIQTLKALYPQAKISAVPYAHYRLQIPQLTITAYHSGKVVFQGKLAQDHANPWQSKSSTWQSPSKEKNKPRKSSIHSTSVLMGSDEVGNGSYFGALTVAAVFLTADQIKYAQTLGIKDSKHLNDQQIIKLSQIIRSEFKHSLRVCNPSEYNRLIGPYNAVSLKVHLHNQVLLDLLNKLNPKEKSLLQGILIDQFTSPANYYKYLNKEETPLKQGLHFKVRSESIHLSVASASILARAAFLQSLQDLGQAYHTKLPSGAGLQVDNFGRQLVAQWGPEVLKNTAKLHFKNTQKILNPNTR